MNIVALGNAASKIADGFSEYPMYTIFKIDVDIENSKYSKSLKKCASPEEYEEKCPSLKSFFKAMKGEDVLFISVGSSPITGCTLRILEQLQNKKVTLLYVRPDLSLLNDKAMLQEKVTFNVLQQYARSGLLNKIFLVDNTSLEQILGEVPITEYYQRINKLLVSTFHLTTVYKHIKPVIETKQDLPEIARIATLGMFDVDTKQDKFFYPIKFTTNQVYYYAYNKEILERDGKIFQNIKKQIKERDTQDTKISFAIYSTEYKQNFVYCEAYTHFVQEENL